MMTQDFPRRNWQEKVNFVLVDVFFSIGLFSLLTGLFWIGDHGLYSKLFYWLMALPALLRLAIQLSASNRMLYSRVFLAFLPFACYMALTIAWSESGVDAISLLKRPLFVFMLFYVVLEFGSLRFDRLLVTVRLAALISLAAGVYALTCFAIAGGQGRLAGYGALFNPLLVSHVFGFFIALWLGDYFSEPRLLKPVSLSAILILGLLLVATGSRTPLLACSVTILWLASLSFRRKGALVICFLLALIGLVLFFAPEVLTQRGLSYRTDIWTNVLQQVKNSPWFGHGYGAPLSIKLDAIDYPLSDPHNVTLSVLFAGGIVGGILWLVLYLVALADSWQLRRNKWVLVCSATVVYGLAAGMTEGGSFLSRPKEHWFLIWIPMALLSAATYRARANEQTN